MIRSAVARECATLKCQAGPAGEVYYSDGASAAVRSGLGPAAFADAVAARTARVVATPENVPLICELYRRGREGAGVRVEVGRPAGVDWAAALRRGPRELLYLVRQIDAEPPSCGGWHAMTEADLPSYQLAAHFAAGGGVCARALELWAAHPAAPALGFIPHLDRGPCARLAAAVLDPRWHVGATRPDRLGPLGHRLGLSASARGPRGRLRALVLSAWKTAEAVPPRVREPGYFLWRRWATADGGPGRADLAASRLFVAYLRGTWLAALDPRPAVGEPLFVPEHFFAGEAATAAAWRRAVPGPR